MSDCSSDSYGDVVCGGLSPANVIIISVSLVTISLLALLCAIRRRRIRRAKMAKINDAIQQLQSQQAASGAEAGHGTPYSSGAAGGGPPPDAPQYPPPVHNGVNSELNSPHMAHNGDPTSPSVVPPSYYAPPPGAPEITSTK